MKIESIVLRELSMSLIHPFATSFGETRERRVLLVEVRAEGLSAGANAPRESIPISAKSRQTRPG